MLTRAQDPALARLAREHLDAVEAARLLDTHLGTLYDASLRGDATAGEHHHAMIADDGPWDQACSRVEAAESALVTALRVRHLAGCIVGGRLCLDNSASLPDHTGSLEAAIVFDLGRIVALDG